MGQGGVIEPGEGDCGGDSSPRPTLELRLPIRRRSPDRPVSPWPQPVATVVGALLGLIAATLWFPPELADSILEAGRSSASASRD